MILRFLAILAVGSCAAFLVGIGAMVCSQDSIIYHPRAYTTSPGSSVMSVEFTTGQGRQVSFYTGAKGDELTELWVLFGGNGSLALDWLPWLETSQKLGRGFLMIEYPGYGSCEGKPTPSSIEENARMALSTLATLGMPVPSRLNVMGHSLGAAAGLNFASRLPMDRVVLFAPFSSMEDIAATMVSRPVARAFLGHRFDNRASFRDLASLSPDVRVWIFHGGRDSIIPVRMSAELLQVQGRPRQVTRTVFESADHNDVVADGWEFLQARGWEDGEMENGK